MIDVSEAIESATEAAAVFLKDVDIVDLRLEEVELDEKRKRWLITLGYSVVSKSPSSTTKFEEMASAITGEIRRVRIYKIFEIDAKSGKPKAMKIRTLA